MFLTGGKEALSETQKLVEMEKRRKTCWPPNKEGMVWALVNHHVDGVLERISGVCLHRRKVTEEQVRPTVHVGPRVEQALRASGASCESRRRWMDPQLHNNDINWSLEPNCSRYMPAAGLIDDLYTFVFNRSDDEPLDCEARRLYPIVNSHLPSSELTQTEKASTRPTSKSHKICKGEVKTEPRPSPTSRPEINAFNQRHLHITTTDRRLRDALGLRMGQDEWLHSL